MDIKAKQRFFSALSNVFIGEVGNKLEGNSGYTNLMKIRNEYFKKVLPELEKKINVVFENRDKEELYNKLYTFFESYLNETGTPFYNKTQLHKNLYEKVYSDRDDVSLFWKTQKLFYVKSEVLYTSMKFDIEGINFEFDASSIEHSQNNEKKELVFVLTNINKENVKFKLYYNDSKGNDIIKAEMKEKDLKNARITLFKSLDTINSNNIVVNKNSIDNKYFYKNETDINKGSIDKGINIFYKQEGLFEKAIVEIGFNKIEDIEDYLKKLNITFKIEFIKKAQFIYKKQNEIDYFISKDADSFLKEQFNLYLYNYIFNDNNTKWTAERIDTIQRIKEIAFECINNISKFENELKAIWLKPKFVRNSNYVLSLDKLENNIELIKKIIASEGFDCQIDEWKRLHEKEEDSNGNEIKKEWKEFEFVKEFDKSLIIQDNKLNEEFKFLPIDTKYFKEIEGEILDSFNNLDESLDGVLIKSDNFQALNTILPKYKERVDLIYIDPPFNTGNDFAYKDGFQDSTWLTLMENRLELSKIILKDNGQFYLHLDHNANYLGRILMNKTFGNDNYKNEIAWYYRRWNIEGKSLASNHDTIFWYVKNKEDYYFKQLYIPKSEKSSAQGKAWKSVIVDGVRKSIQTQEETKGVPLPDMWELNISEEIEVMPDLWKISMINPVSLERTGFNTQKPEELIKRILDISSKENQLVLDYFSGSGTTISTAHKLNRKWLGVEMGAHFYEKVLPRLKKVIVGDTNGISKNIECKKGGVFKYYELEQYEDILRKSKYSDKDNLSLTMYNSERLAECLTIEGTTVKIDFKELYSDVDIAETISNLSGKKIKKLNDKRVIFEDNTEIVFDNINWKENKNLKPLFWWGDTNE